MKVKLTAFSKLIKDKTWSSLSNSTWVLYLVPYPLTLDPEPFSLPIVPYPLTPSTVPFKKIQLRVLVIVIVIVVVVVIPSKNKVNS